MVSGLMTAKQRYFGDSCSVSPLLLLPKVFSVTAASAGTAENFSRVILSICFGKEDQVCYSYVYGDRSEIGLLSPEILVMLLQVILKFIALRYTDISALKIGNVSFSYDCFSNLPLKTLLRPFEEAAYWKTSLKALYIEHLNLWLDDETTDLASYPEHVQKVWVNFRSGGSNDAKRTIFEIMEKSNAIGRFHPDALATVGSFQRGL